jgi:hypothetical protein
MNSYDRTPPRVRRQPPVGPGRRWAARCALLAVSAALLIPLIFAGLHSLVLLSIGVIGLGVIAARLWWALTHRGAARVAAEHGIPFLVISAGTRNHFALDLGLDRDDPSRCLDALTNGVELHIDIGDVNGRPFVNNESFGAYAEVVQSPEYRADKTQTALRRLPDLLAGHTGAWLTAPSR